LRRAFDEFAAMGANAFAERVRRELEATGEKVRVQRGEPFDELTPQEHQIAQLARTRRTNAEIGAEVFLRARTVGWHRLREGHFSFRDRGPSGTRLYVVTVAIRHGVRA
jgi:FixJ family two-component response regulator